MSWVVSAQPVCIPAISTSANSVPRDGSETSLQTYHEHECMNNLRENKQQRSFRQIKRTTSTKLLFCVWYRIQNYNAASRLYVL